MRKLSLNASVLALSLIATGCATIESSGGNVGVAYTLPKGQVQFTVHRFVVTPDHVREAKKAEMEALALVKADTEALKAAQADLEQQKKILEKITDTKDPAYAVTQQKVTIATAVVAYLTDKQKADKTISDIAQKTAADLALQIGSMQETAVVKPLPVVPDSERSARFVANMRHLITRDDKVKITVANGMLSSSDMTSRDRTGDILVEIAKIASLFFGAPPGLLLEGPQSDEPQAPAVPNCGPYHISMAIDPTDMIEVLKLRKSLKTAGSVYDLDLDPAPLLSVPGTDPMMMNLSAVGATYKKALEERLATYVDVLSEDEEEKVDAVLASISGPANSVLTEQSGLFYRAPISVNIRMKIDNDNIKTCDKGTQPQESIVSVTVPDTKKTFVIPMDAGLFTTVTQNVTFKDGMITAMDANRESELLAIIGVPLQIARAFMSIPTEFLKLRVDYDNAKVAETNAEIEQLKAQLEALKAAEALKAHQTGAPSP